MIKLGIDLIDQYQDFLKGKRIGLITNPTGLNGDLRSTIDILHEKFHLNALFSPEHGVRGDLQAGVKADDYMDQATGVKVYSLYGDHKKPSKEMMDEIDILAFDIQDVGARFYTFLYTMAYAMMACKEHNKPMIIFDRPNPVNAEAVEGNLLDINYRSFVGYYPIPQRYGLTIGELALLFNDAYDIHADISIAKMQGYKRSMDFEATQLDFIYPSPNIPNKETTYTYLATCVFEGTNMSEGRGTTKPFTMFGSPYLDHLWLIDAIKAYQLPGFKLRPTYFTPSFSKHKDKLCRGLEIIITDKDLFQPVYTGFVILKLIEEHHPEFAYLEPYRKGGRPFIDLLVGDCFLRENTLNLDQIRQKMNHDAQAFKVFKRRYHIYD